MVRIAAGGDALLVVGPEGPIVSEGEHQEVPLHSPCAL